MSEGTSGDLSKHEGGQPPRHTGPPSCLPFTFTATPSTGTSSSPPPMSAYLSTTLGSWTVGVLHYIVRAWTMISKPVAAVSESVKVTCRATASTLYHSTITPCYHIQIAFWKVIAVITGRAFIVRHTSHLPTFLARPDSNQLIIFRLTRTDLENIDPNTRYHMIQFHNLPPKWRPEYWVTRAMGSNTTGFPPIPLIDLRKHQLVHTEWSQGCGLIGDGICIILIEVYGFWPGGIDSVIGLAYCMLRRRIVHCRFPPHFVASPSEEMMRRLRRYQAGGYGRHTVVTIEWNDVRVEYTEEEALPSSPNILPKASLSSSSLADLSHDSHHS